MDDFRDTLSDTKFCHFYQCLFNPTCNSHLNYVPAMFKYIPILNDTINLGEVVDGINKLDIGKAAGVYSIPPGVLKIPGIFRK